jgi:hypothetical protein
MATRPRKARAARSARKRPATRDLTASRATATGARGRMFAIVDRSKVTMFPPTPRPE